MMTIQKMEQKLQKADHKQAKLYLFCNFLSLMLISAYSAMMCSPTVLNILPGGGDSRKQMYAIFTLALFGCVVFTVYAASLFFRKKSRQLGILMALGASRKRLAPGLFREVLSLSFFSSFAGILAGFPFIWILWNLFRIFIIDSAEMKLILSLKCLLISVPFFLLVVAFACFTAFRYLQKTNILDVVQEEHKNEPVKSFGKWCGPVGIILLLFGAIAGYSGPMLYQTLFQAYSPAWINLLYAPVFIGLYLIMLHTVTHGWKSIKRNPYKNIISRSMMKFQGRQTVNNLLVTTVLIAGACFAVFYTPMLGTGSMIETNNRTYDYLFHYRADQDVMSREEIEAQAAEYGLTLTDWNSCDYLTLAMDGMERIEEEDGSFYFEYTELLQSGKFLSASAFADITGQSVNVAPGTYLAVSNTAETSLYVYLESTQLTNMSTRAKLPVKFAGLAHYDMLTDSVGYYILNDADYQTIAEGLTKDWMGEMFCFNADGTDSYPFATSLFHRFVDCFGPECELPHYYDPVIKAKCDENGEVYWGDTDDMTAIHFSKPDASDFRAYWTYMPKIRILDQNDFLRNFAVFLMIFIFIAIVCMSAALVISYTRCQTIALNNHYIFDDLKKLGASPDFLATEVKKQCRPIFQIPSLVGMTAMFLLYSMIMYANDGKFEFSEICGLGVCLSILLIIGVLIYLVYLRTIQTVKRNLGIL